MTVIYMIYDYIGVDVRIADYLFSLYVDFWGIIFWIVFQRWRRKNE